jgi:predicted site-specific integrase-resolvase
LREVAEATGMSQSFLKMAIREGRIRVTRLKTAVRVADVELNRIVAEGL